MIQYTAPMYSLSVFYRAVTWHFVGLIETAKLESPPPNHTLPFSPCTSLL